MRKIIIALLLVVSLTIPSFACVTETKPGIVGNRVVVTVPEDQHDDGGIWRNPHSGVICEGCEEVNRLKEKEYDDSLFGLWTWKLPSWWYMLFYWD